MEAHELAPLKNRLTANEEARRRAKLHRRGMGRIDLQREQQVIKAGFMQGFEATDKQFGIVRRRHQRQMLYTWIAIGVLGVAFAAKIFGLI